MLIRGAYKLTKRLFHPLGPEGPFDVLGRREVAPFADAPGLGLGRGDEDGEDVAPDFGREEELARAGEYGLGHVAPGERFFEGEFELCMYGSVQCIVSGGVGRRREGVLRCL